MGDPWRRPEWRQLQDGQKTRPENSYQLSCNSLPRTLTECGTERKAACRPTLRVHRNPGIPSGMGRVREEKLSLRGRKWWFDITNDRGRHQGPTRNAIRLRFSAVLPFPVSTSFNPPSTYFSMETFLRAESTTEQILDALSLRVERQLSTCDQNLKNKDFQSMVRDQDAFTTLCWEPEY